MTNFESLIITRRSTRKYKEDALTPDEAQKILQAALLAPTAKNGKPWEFVAIDNKDLLHQLSTCKNTGATFLAGCTLGVVVLADQTQTDTWIEDASIAATFMQLQAQDLGIGSCWCHIRHRYLNETPSEYTVRTLLNIPDHYGILCIIGFGYKDQERRPNDPTKLPWEKIHINQFTPPNTDQTP
jgi:nitroreductase